MRGFIKAFAFLMLGLGLVAAPGYWTYVNFLSASTLMEQRVYERENPDRAVGAKSEASGAMPVYLTPDMNPLQILARLDVVKPAGDLKAGLAHLNVEVVEAGARNRHIWAATTAVFPEFGAGDGMAATAKANLGTLYISEPGDYVIRGSVDQGDSLRIQRMFLQVRRDVIEIRWGFFGIGILLILGAVILYRVADDDEA